jgi:hypothetical protein
VLTPHGLAELESFSEADPSQLGSEGVGFSTGWLRPRLKLAIEKDSERVMRRLGHGEPQLESAPDRAIEQLSVVRRGHRNHVTWKLIDLHE